MLKIENLTCGYDTKFVLNNINFELYDGELLGIIGPNGSGKTTLLRAITKVIQPIRGNIILEKENINKLTTKQIAQKIAVVSQSSDIEFDITVEELVYMGRIPFRKKLQFFETKHDEEIVNKSLIMTDVIKLSKRYINELSGGERQLVYIAKALAQEPKLLILDEPTSHLDISHQVKILDLVKKLNNENKLTVIVVLHDLNLASEYCDRLILLNNGILHKIGTPEEVLTYQIIEDVFKTTVVVGKSPVTHNIYVYIVPQKYLSEQKKLN
jgi:iron complex transport system ATP-binding protein